MPAFTIELPNGKRMDVEADDENAAISGAQDWFKQNVTDKNDTSLTGALQQGATGLVSGVGSTIKNLVSKDAGQAVMDAAQAKANPKYKSAYESFANPEDGADKHFMGLDWSSAPRALLEQAPALATDLMVQRLLKRTGPIGQAVGGAVNYGLRSAGNEIQKRATARTGDENAEPTLEDKAVGLASTGAQGLLNSYGANKIINPSKVTATGLKGVAQTAGNVVKAAAAEGATSGAQSLISEGAAKAGTNEAIDTHGATADAVLGALGGGAFSGVSHGVKGTAQALRTSGTDHGPHSEMAANRILDKVSKPSDLEDPQKAYDATSAAIKDVHTEFSDAAKDVSAPSQETANAIQRVKTGQALTAKELAAIDAEGNDSLSSLARQATSLAALTTHGSYDQSEGRFAGGAGEQIRKLVTGNKVAATAAAAVPSIAHNGFAGMDSLMSAVPGMAQTAAGGYAAYKLLRAGERLAGISSPARAFTDKFGSQSGQVRPAAAPSPMAAAGVSVPQVTPKNSLTTPQPWGPVADKPTPFKPDMLDSNLQKIVDKLQNQKRRDTAQEMLPLLRQLAAQNQPAPEAPGMDVNGLNEQIKGAMLMASARRKIAGQQQAEAEAAESPMINEQGGLDAIRNPAMGKRAQELIAAANALARLRRQPEEQEAPPIAPAMPESPQPPYHSPTQAPPTSMADILQRLHSASAPEAPQPSPTPPPAPEPFVLPESPHVFKDPKTAARDIHAEAVAGGKEIRNAEGYKAGTQRRLAGEEAIYERISSALNSVKERGDFHKYLAALWGSDSPEVVTKVREHMLSEFPHHADTINKHLSDEAIKGLWTKAKKKK